MRKREFVSPLWCEENEEESGIYREEEGTKVREKNIKIRKRKQ